MKIILPTLATVVILLSSCSENKTTTAAGAASNSAGPPEAANTVMTTPALIVTRMFQSADLNQNGTLTLPEGTAYMDSVLISKDTNNDGSLSLKEFQDWDPGFLYIAKKDGFAAKYNARKEEIFKRWDANDDGRLTLEEFHGSIVKEFAAASLR